MKQLSIFGAMLLVISSMSLASADIIVFSDSFEGRTNGSGDGNGNPAGTGNGSSSWGTNNNALGGTLTPAYITTPSRTGGANQVVGLNQFDGSLGNHGHLLNGSVAFDLGSLTTLGPDGFRVAFDFDRRTDPASAAGTGFIAFGLGVNSLDPVDLGGLAAISRTEFGMLFQQANLGNAANAQAFENLGLQSLGTVDYLNPTTRHSVLLTFTPQVSGAYGNGAVINYNALIDGSISLSGSFTSEGQDLNRMVFSNSATAQGYVDNIVVTAIPEPSGFIGLSILAIATIARRRRE